MKQWFPLRVVFEGFSQFLANLRTSDQIRL